MASVTTFSTQPSMHLTAVQMAIVNSGVADHVAVRVVQDDEVLLVGVDSFNELLGYDRSAHLRLEIVCRHLRRRNQDSVLVLERSFAAALKKNVT